MTVNTTDTKARRRARPRPEQHRPEQHHPNEHRLGQPRDLGIGAHLAGENAFTYGLLYEDERHQAERRQADARKVWKRASRSRYRGWMK